MPVVRINAITVPDDLGDEVARRFGQRLGAVEGQPGFRRFQLLRPTDERNVWLVITEWDDEDAFSAWVRSPAFAEGHRAALGGAEAPTPLPLTAELWAYDVELTTPADA